jgi:hypothetical protein
MWFLESDVWFIYWTRYDEKGKSNLKEHHMQHSAFSTREQSGDDVGEDEYH